MSLLRVKVQFTNAFYFITLSKPSLEICPFEFFCDFPKNDSGLGGQIPELKRRVRVNAMILVVT